ncbi:MAG: hypothetical protein ACLP1X_28840 [Polyangiaceae bacterium]
MRSSAPVDVSGRVVAVLAACSSLAWGCGGTTTGSGAADASSGSEPCSVVLASDYDQSCTVDTDCTLVGEVPSCPAEACDGCTLWAINKGAITHYMTAFSQAFASVPSGTGCGCIAEDGPCCRGGQCTAMCSSSTDVLPACADAGGFCSLGANISCGSAGPPDSCAYSDEVCCLPSTPFGHGMVTEAGGDATPE